MNGILPQCIVAVLTQIVERNIVVIRPVMTTLQKRRKRYYPLQAQIYPGYLRIKFDQGLGLGESCWKHALTNDMVHRIISQWRARQCRYYLMLTTTNVDGLHNKSFPIQQPGTSEQSVGLT